MAVGRQVIATGAVAWKRVLCIPPLRNGGASAGPGSIDPLRHRLPRSHCGKDVRRSLYRLWSLDGKQLLPAQ